MRVPGSKRKKEAPRLPLDELSRKLKEIQDKMSEALHYSIDSISSLREEERERLFEVRTRKEDLIRELNEVIDAAAWTHWEGGVRVREVDLGLTDRPFARGRMEAFEQGLWDGIVQLPSLSRDWCPCPRSTSSTSMP